jgi:sulfide:quinone oxidoreductase
VQAEITAIDPTTKRVETSAGPFDADVLVVALGADVDPASTPGLVEGGHEFYTQQGAYAVRDILEGFDGGRVIIGISSIPYKCPPAPSETALLLHEFLTARGRRDRSEISIVTPQPAPIPPSPTTSAALLAAFAERGIEFKGSMQIRELDPAANVARYEDGTELPYDLYLGVPTHRAPAVVVEAGLTVEGWVAVDPMTLETPFPGVFAIGDVTNMGTPKAGVFAERHGEVAAERIAALIRSEGQAAEYDGRGLCYIDFGGGQAGRVNVQFTPGEPLIGLFDGPSLEVAADKAEFGRSRARRWFAKDWVT